MTFRWYYFASDGSGAGESDAFDDRPDAEAWLSDEWASLSDGGVMTVALTEGDDELYRMSLEDQVPGSTSS